MWHRLLLFLHLRNELDWAPPGLGPEVPHPYQEYERLPCCVHCGGGKRHPIHRPPFNARRLEEIAARAAQMAPRPNTQYKLTYDAQAQVLRFVPNPDALKDTAADPAPRER